MSFASAIGGLYGTPTYDHFLKARDSSNDDASETESIQSGSTITARHDDVYFSSLMPSVSAGQDPPWPTASTSLAAQVEAPPPPKQPRFGVTLQMQPKLLKQINGFSTKEELLNFTSTCHSALDPINLVTSIYRLARMYSDLRHPEVRATWRAELSASPTFAHLLHALQAQMAQAQAGTTRADMRGVDARCVSNLVWAMVKLDLCSGPSTASTAASAASVLSSAGTSSCAGSGAASPSPMVEDVHALGTALVLGCSPLVMRLLPSCSPQGLANLIWSYAKMQAPPMQVMVAITRQMTAMLNANPDSPIFVFDAQALSNSVWALAHTRCRACDLDALAGRPGTVLEFLTAVAHSATAMLRALAGAGAAARPETHPQAYICSMESRFSCQALVNIVWSFASLLGDECGAHGAIKALFVKAKHEAVLRLRATANALAAQQAWVWHAPGGFNEQALSNIVYAYDKAGLLDRDLLAWVFNVAALRLDRKDAPPSFKPQELCTLLRAAHLPIATPLPFLTKLMDVLQNMPWITRTWSPSEIHELQRAFNLLACVLPPAAFHTSTHEHKRTASASPFQGAPPSHHRQDQPHHYQQQHQQQHQQQAPHHNHPQHQQHHQGQQQHTSKHGPWPQVNAAHTPGRGRGPGISSGAGAGPQGGAWPYGPAVPGSQNPLLALQSLLAGHIQAQAQANVQAQVQLQALQLLQSAAASGALPLSMQMQLDPGTAQVAAAAAALATEQLLQGLNMDGAYYPAAASMSAASGGNGAAMGQGGMDQSSLGACSAMGVGLDSGTHAYSAAIDSAYSNMQQLLAGGHGSEVHGGRMRHGSAWPTGGLGAGWLSAAGAHAMSKPIPAADRHWSMDVHDP